MSPFYYGIVEDVLDPKELSRVKVRIFGLHTHDQVLIPTSSLPWASVVQPTTSAANSGIGTTPRLLEGSLVMITFADGENMQLPLVLGSIPSEIKETVLNINGKALRRDPGKQGFQDPKGYYPRPEYRNDIDTNKLARGYTFTETQMYNTRTMQKVVDHTVQPQVDLSYPCANPPRVPTVAQDKEDAYYREVSWVEPPIAAGSFPEYPNNQVRESATGIVEEWDDTPSGTRIHKFHPSGTFEEIVDDGTRTIKIIGKDYEMYLDGKNVFIDGNLNLTVTGDKRELIQGNYHLEVEGEMTLEVKESYQTKINKDVATEIGGNRTTNITSNDITFTSGNTTETTVKDKVNVVNGSYSSSITKDANYMFQANVTAQTLGEFQETIIGNVKTTIGGTNQHLVAGNKIDGVLGTQDTTVTGNVTETFSSNQTTTITGNLDVDASRIDLN